jgi:hypothetical protein
MLLYEITETSFVMLTIVMVLISWIFVDIGACHGLGKWSGYGRD